MAQNQTKNPQISDYKTLSFCQRTSVVQTSLKLESGKRTGFPLGKVMFWLGEAESR
jgi:hypothetical protein